MTRLNAYTELDKMGILAWIDREIASYEAEQKLADNETWKRNVVHRLRTARKCRDVITGDIFKEGYGASR